MASIAVMTDPKCAGGTVLCRVADFVSCEFTTTIGGDRGNCILVLPADSAAVRFCAIFNVLRLTDDDGTVYEYRIVTLDDGATEEVVTVTAVDLSHDLGRIQLSQVVGGASRLTFAPGPLTPTQIIDTYVVPALVAAGITWVVRDTVTPTKAITLTWQRSTPLGVLAALESATKAEFWLERNGDTNYKIMLGRRTATGSPVAWVGRNVETLGRRIAVDERFFNRALPFGATLSGESEPTHLGQHGWNLSAVSGDNLTLTNPAGGTGAIGSDDQLNGLAAGVSLDAIGGPIGYSMPVGRAAIAYDDTRRRVWWISGSPSTAAQNIVCWHDLTDNTRGTVTISGAVVFHDLLYCAGRDEVLVACNDGAKVARINASTKAVAGSIATSANPSRLFDLTSQGKTQLGVGFNSGTTGVELYDLTALTLVTTFAGSTAADQWVCYDSSSTRYFVGGATRGTVDGYTAAYASVGAVTPFSGTGVTNGIPVSGTLYLLKAGQNIRPLTCSTMTLGTDTAIANVESVTYSFGGIFRPAVIDGRLYVLATTGNRGWILAINPATSYSVDAAARAPVGGNSGMFVYSTTDDCFVVLQSLADAPVAFLLYRNGSVAPSGRLRFTVQDTVAATQQVVKPSTTKGPILPGQLVEFRADTSDTYLAALTDPASVAVYGPVDGYPQFADLYKRNYKADPQHAIWASNLPAWLGIRTSNPMSTVSSVGSLKWDRAVAQASAASTTGLINGAQVLSAGVKTLNLRGLAAGRVVQVGTCVYFAFASGVYGWVMASATADGSGNASVTIYCAVGGTAPDGSSVTLFSPSQSQISASQAVALLPFGGGGGNIYPLRFVGGVHLPRISGATQAWIRLRLFVLGFNANATDVKVDFFGCGFTSPTTLTPGSRAGGGPLSPEMYELVLEQQVDLASIPAGRDDFLTFALQAVTTWTNSNFLSAYLTGVEVYVATSAACPTPLGATPGEELAPWIGSNELLFTQGRASPTVDYTVQFIEDGVAVSVGQTAVLRDPRLGIAATPRIVSVTRTLPRDKSEIRRPVVQLNNRPLSAMESLSAVGA